MNQVQQKKKGKGGRPIKPVKKDVRTGVRFTKSEYFLVKGMALKAGMRYTGYIRHMALFGAVVPRLNDEERAWLKLLIGMANNINQISKQAHKDGIPSAMLAFESYRQQLDNVINWLKRDK